MRLLWTKSPNLVDKVIHAFTKEDCAHFAILFESKRGTGVVFESNLLGTHPAFYKSWMGKSREIIHSKQIDLTEEQENVLWDKWVEHFDGHEYDFWGALYLGFCKLRKRLFGTALPSTNKWSKQNTYYCDVIYQLISGIPGCPVIDAQTNGMSSPHDLWEIVSRVV